MHTNHINLYKPVYKLLQITNKNCIRSTWRFWKVIHFVIEIAVRLTVQRISCYAKYDFTQRQITVHLTVQASRITLVMKMHLMDGNPCRGIIILIIRLGKCPSPIFHLQHCSPALIPARCGMAQACASVCGHMRAKRMRYDEKHDGLGRVATHMHQTCHHAYASIMKNVNFLFSVSEPLTSPGK